MKCIITQARPIIAVGCRRFNKVDTADPEAVIAVREKLYAANPNAEIIERLLRLCDDPEPIAVNGFCD
jgi:G3E family GTPase